MQQRFLAKRRRDGFHVFNEARAAGLSHDTVMKIVSGVFQCVSDRHPPARQIDRQLAEGEIGTSRPRKLAESPRLSLRTTNSTRGGQPQPTARNSEDGGRAGGLDAEAPERFESIEAADWAAPRCRLKGSVYLREVAKTVREGSLNSRLGSIKSNLANALRG
jgi:hypothetical protein